MRPAADAKGVKPLADLDHIEPVNGDPNCLQQVLWNLLSNAVKFTPRSEHIRVQLQRVKAHVEIRVIDTGDGISADFLPHVFDRFSQTDASMSRWHGGLGLGLAIVKRPVELHGGTVRADSAGRGRGATFIVSLPMAAIQRDATSTARQYATPRPAACLTVDGVDITGVRVLVLDDEPDS